MYYNKNIKTNGEIMKKLLIATHNAGKLKEFTKLFENKFEVLSLPYNGFDGEAEETGSTFFENALLKAKYVHDNTGEMVLADDSGLCVNALNGEPGIYSARYGGENSTQEQKNSLLLSKLKPFDDRSAKFVCSLVLYGNGKVLASGYGETLGSILHEIKGSGGFGYDSLFFSDDLKMSFGECTDEQKNTVSHRSRAIKDLIKNMQGLQF